MQYLELKEFFVLVLVAIKQAYESDEFSEDDRKTLVIMFEQGLVYQSMLNHEVLCDEQFVKCIGAFGALVQQVLPPPESCDFSAVSLALVKASLPTGKEHDVLVDAQVTVDNIFKAILINLMSVFQCSILDLSAKLVTECVLSAVDVDNTNYVVGMAQITTANLSALIEQADISGEATSENTCKFLFDTIGLASSLKLSGLGMSA